MSSYKVIYLDAAGLAEPIRYLLSYAGVDYQDDRITYDEWLQIKPTTPMEQLPLLEYDGKMLHQSNAICRFLAKKFHLLGSNELEAFEVDATIETIGDMRQVLAKWFWYSSPAQKSATEAETRKKLAFYFGKFEALATENGGYFVAEKLTAADIVFAGCTAMFLHTLGKECFADYPTLKNLIDKVLDLPGIKSYVARHPVTQF